MSNKNNNKASNSSNSSNNNSSGNLKNKFFNSLENIKVNRNIILVSFAIIISILFFYYNSMSYKVNKSLRSLSNYKEFVITGTKLS